MAKALVVAGLILNWRVDPGAGVSREAEPSHEAAASVLDAGLRRWFQETRGKFSFGLALALLFVILLEIWRDREWSEYLIERFLLFPANLMSLLFGLPSVEAESARPAREWDLTAGFDAATAASLIAGLITVAAALTVALIAAPSLQSRTTDLEKISLYYWSLAASGGALVVSALSLAVAFTQIRTFEVAFALMSASLVMLAISAVTSQRVVDSRRFSVALSQMFVWRQESRMARLESGGVFRHPGLWVMRGMRVLRPTLSVAFWALVITLVVWARGNLSSSYFKAAIPGYGVLLAILLLGLHWWFVGLMQAWWFAKAQGSRERQREIFYWMLALTVGVGYLGGRLIARVETAEAGLVIALEVLFLAFALQYWAYFGIAALWQRGPGMIEAWIVHRRVGDRLDSSRNRLEASLNDSLHASSEN